jgi:tetraacyldisaccharide 4'-kinase
VGNLTVGGTGKTPVVAWLARHLQSIGRRPAVVSRGYGGTAGKGPLTVSEGGGAVCRARQCGDEPYLLAQSLSGVVVVVGSDRVADVGRALTLGADVVVLDDAFQHRRLARDLDLVLLDAGNPFGDRSILPAGPLREPISALARADLVLVTRSRRGERLAAIEQVVRRQNPAVPVLGAGHRSAGFFDPRGRPADRPRRAVAFCGIAYPDLFRIDLEAEGVEIAAFRAARDHHRYSDAELEGLGRLAAARDAALVTTEKDLARIEPERLAHVRLAPLLVLRIEAVVYDPEPLIEAIRRVLEETRC